MDEPSPFYDPAEIVLISTGPYVGLNLENRITAADVVGSAEMDLKMDPDQNISGQEAMLKDFIEPGSMSEDLLDYLSDTVPTVVRKGVFISYGERYAMEFRIWGSIDGRANLNANEVNAVIQKGEYLWSLYVFEYDVDSRDNQGNSLFFAMIEKSRDEEKEKNTVKGYDLNKVPAGMTTITDKVSDIDMGKDRTDDTFLGLIHKLGEFADKYPIDTIIDPVTYTLDFLRTIQSE